jgi:hypothetical protein
MILRRPLRAAVRSGALALALVVTARPAHAQAGEGALAEALFRSARALIAEGKYAEACPKFAESKRIDPKLGTLMNLALCHANEGKTASAWAEYTQAAELAARAGGTRARGAKGGSGSRGVLPHIVLRAATADPLVVTLDGKTLGASVLGTALPVDPGLHELAATAPGRASFTKTVTVPVGGGEQTINIPALEPAAPVAPPVLVVSPTPAVEATESHSLLGYSLIGGGAFAIVMGSVFGGVALAEKSAAAGQCSAVSCTSTGQSDFHLMQASEATSTIAIGAGLVSACAGVYFILRSRKHGESPAAPAGPSARVDPFFGPDRAGLLLSGAF